MKPTALPSLCALVSALLLQGCAAPVPAPALPERVSGVLGSATQAQAQARAPSPSQSPAPAPAPEAAAAAHPPSREAAEGKAALRAAEDAYARGDWVTAAREFKALSGTYPRNGQVWFGYGAASALAGNLDEAAAGFEAALRVDARDARAAYNLGLIRLSQADMALVVARGNAGSAPADIQQAIARLSADLAPVFNRQANQPAGASQDAFRTQDPARAAQATARPLPASEAQVTPPSPAPIAR